MRHCDLSFSDSEGAEQLLSKCPATYTGETDFSVSMHIYFCWRPVNANLQLWVSSPEYFSMLPLEFCHSGQTGIKNISQTAWTSLFLASKWHEKDCNVCPNNLADVLSCRLILMLGLTCHGMFLAPSLLFFVENRLGRAQRFPGAGFISAGPQNLSQKYLL